MKGKEIWGAGGGCGERECDAVSQIASDHIRTEQQEAGTSLQRHVTSSYSSALSARAHTHTRALKSACIIYEAVCFFYFRLLHINTHNSFISTDENFIRIKSVLHLIKITGT